MIIISLLLFFGTLGLGQAMGLWQLKNDEIGGDTLIIEVANRYNIPLELIYETWNIPSYISPRTELAEARDEAGFSIGRLRIWVTAYIKEHHDELPAELAALEDNETDGDELNISGAFTLQQLSYYFGIPLEKIHHKFSLPQNLPPQTTIRELREQYDVELGEIKIWLQISSDGLPYYYALQAGKPLHPDHIREWMTIQQVSQAAGMPLDYFYAQANLPSNLEGETSLGELEEKSGFTIENVRNVVKEYYLVEPDIELSEPHLPSPGATQGNYQTDPMGAQQAEPYTLDPDLDGIRGNSTIEQVCQHYDISREWLLEQLDLPTDTPGNQTLRSLGLDLGQVRIIMGEYEERNQ